MSLNEREELHSSEDRADAFESVVIILEIHFSVLKSKLVDDSLFSWCLQTPEGNPACLT